MPALSVVEGPAPAGEVFAADAGASPVALRVSFRGACIGKSTRFTHRGFELSIVCHGCLVAH